VAEEIVAVADDRGLRGVLRGVVFAEHVDAADQRLREDGPGVGTIVDHRMKIVRIDAREA
jgi:hypothetical protein